MRAAARLVVVALLGACTAVHEPPLSDTDAPFASDSATACGSIGSCGAPLAITYSCAPLAAGSPGCDGAPLVYSDCPVPDPTATYPDGCTLRFPFCNPYYSGSVAQCTCVIEGATRRWSCPL